MTVSTIILKLLWLLNQVSTAKRWYKRSEEEGHINKRPWAGRHHVLSAEQETEIIDRIREDPFLTAMSFAREFHVDPGVISALFHRHGLKCRIAATEVRLTEDHRINRIAFCRTLLEEWDQDKLDSVIFCDEKTFSTDPYWQTKVYRVDDARFEPDYVTVKDTSGHITHNYWGAIGHDGPVTPIVRILGRFNAPKYANIIRNEVIPMMERFADEGEPKICMQDNSPVHTAASVMELFSRQQFELMPWPPKSPDLNPIENVWARMVYGWPQIHPRNDQNLHNAVVERWNNLNGNHRRFSFEHKTI